MTEHTFVASTMEQSVYIHWNFNSDWGRCEDQHLTDGGTEAWRGEAWTPCPEPQTCSWLEDQYGSQHLSWDIRLQREAKRSSCRLEAVWSL